MLKNSGPFMHMLADGVRNSGVDIDLRYLGNLRSARNLLIARRMIKRVACEFDLIHAQFGSACAVATAGGKNTVKLLSLRGSDWYRYNEKWNYESLHSLIATVMSRSVLKQFDAVVVMSNRMAVDVHERYPDVNLVTIPDPINLLVFKPIDKMAARAALGCPNDNDKWILFTTASTRNQIKRFRLAQEAVGYAKQNIGGIKLRVATGIEPGKMPLFVGCCDLVLSTSVYEGWPNAIKESLACNVPFVATDVSDLRDIANQEPSCRVCSPEPHAIAESICDVLSINNVGNLRRHVLGMDVPLVSKQIVDLYQQLVSGNQE